MKRSIAYEKISAALKEGKRLSKHDAEALVPCHQRTAQRVLKELYEKGEIRIHHWEPIYKQVVPVFVRHDGKEDAVKPYPTLASERQRKYRQREEVRERDRLRKQTSRMLKRQQAQARTTTEIFNLIVIR